MAIATVTRAGISLSCRATGPAGTDCGALFIHGLNTNMAFWHPQIVRHVAAERRVVLYDQRGHGASDLPPSGYTLDELAADAAAVLDAHELAAADVVAHSFGSGVALQLARLYPERVRSLTILDGRLRAIQGEVRLRDWSFFATWAEEFAAAQIPIDPDWPIDCLLPLRMEGIDFSLVSAGLQAHGFFVPRGQKRSGEKYRRLILETAAQAEYDQPCGLTTEALSEIRQPVLLVYGTMSPFLPTRDILAVELPDARVEMIEGAGHNFPITQPEQTLRALAQGSAWDWLPDLSSQPTN